MSSSDNEVLRRQVGAILRAAAGAFQATATATVQYATLIEAGGSLSPQDMAQLSMPFAHGTMLPPFDANLADRKKRKGKLDTVIFQPGFTPPGDGNNADGKKRKRAPAKVKKVKDPNAPKRPPSAYLLYQNEFRKEIKEKNPELTYPQVLQEISKMWANLSPEDKKPYQDATDLAKVDFEKAKTEYQESHPAVGDGVGHEPTDDASDSSGSPLLPKTTSTVGALVDELAKNEEKRRRKAAKAKAAAAGAAKPAPPPPPPLAPVAPLSESLSNESDEEEEDEEEEDEEEQEPPKKKNKKAKTPPPSPGKGKKDKRRK